MRTFDPWKGDRYDEGIDGRRILILGESHYGLPGGEYRDYTKDRIQKWCLDRRRHRFFTAAQRLIVGGKGRLTDSERLVFWHRVAFYNYVQSFAGDRPRHRPSDCMWEDAVEPLRETLLEFDPQFILALGIELSNKLRDLKLQQRICSVQHPSSPRFNLAHWHAIVKTALNDSDRSGERLLIS